MVIVSDAGVVSVTVAISLLKFLIVPTVSWVVFIVPCEKKESSAKETKDPGITIFDASVVNLNIFSPVSNLGFVDTFGFGTHKTPLTFPAESVTNLILVTLATAPLLFPTNLIPTFI